MATPRRVIIFLCIGLAAASQSGNIIRIGDAHPVVMTTWRLAIASLLLAFLARRELTQLKRLDKRERFLLGLAGLALAFHFFTWTAAVQLTTVANATVFFSFNPVITATAGYFIFGERASKRLFLSIALGIAGVAAIGGGDLSFNREHLAGDGMALLCSVLFTVYFLVGKRLRQRLPTGAYVTSVYGTAAVVGFISLSILDLPAVDYSGRTWLCFILLALIPTMIGHTSVNNALKYIAAGKISTATLSEPLLAGLVAYFAWDEEVTVQTAVGYVLISLSVIVLVSRMGAKRNR
ncbi:MAG: DMT family transporter [Planctomycetota bacterium]|jgi:drug/metabolite transporter (DMT)-like permease